MNTNANRHEINTAAALPSKVFVYFSREIAKYCMTTIISRIFHASQDFKISSKFSCEIRVGTANSSRPKQIHEFFTNEKEQRKTF